MDEHILRTREAVQQASDDASQEQVEAQLDAVRTDLESLSRDGPPDPERLAAVEETLLELIDETDGEVREMVQLARDRLDKFRREYAQ
jgi:hypothetical protein